MKDMTLNEKEKSETKYIESVSADRASKAIF